METSIIDFPHSYIYENMRKRVKSLFPQSDECEIENISESVLRYTHALDAYNNENTEKIEHPFLQFPTKTKCLSSLENTDGKNKETISIANSWKLCTLKCGLTIISLLSLLFFLLYNIISGLMDKAEFWRLAEKFQAGAICNQQAKLLSVLNASDTYNVDHPYS